ncbi:MAG: hypothetical protein HYU27_00530 [Acidobacteria bacterium]|nr:hypothetical protein [Acidobacteriota bacterium]
MLRKRFLDDLETVAAGGDPKAVIRDTQVNKCLALPIAERRALIEGLPWDEMIKHPFLGRELIDGYPFQSGQPDDIRRLFEDAMGITAHRSRILASNSATSSP